MEKFNRREVKYCGIFEFGDWKFKMYRLAYNELRDTSDIKNIVKEALPNWVKIKSQLNEYPHYKIGIVIIHEAKDNILVVVNWWIYENVLQGHVYASDYMNPHKFTDLSDKGLQFCVWEMTILWHERNLWVEHILKKPKHPDWSSYISQYYSLDYVE